MLRGVRHFYRQVFPYGGIVALLALIGLVFVLIQHPVYRFYFLLNSAKLSVMDTFNAEVFHFMTESKRTSPKRSCTAVTVNKTRGIHVQYPLCSEEVIAQESEPVAVSSLLDFPKSFARRVHFWKRVYSFYSRSEFVLHAAEFPEVVFEIYNLKELNFIGDRLKDKHLKPLKESRIKEYQILLFGLHDKQSKGNLRFTPAEERIVGLMRHISRADKYLAAAESLRVQKGQKEYIEKGLKFAVPYMSHIENEFEKEGIPRELARLCFVESSFNPFAQSKVGASGVFQLMPDTSQDFALVVANGIDERNDPIKASRAAAKLLKLNYKILGEWPLAVTAYNHGVGGINRAINKVRSRRIDRLVDEYDGTNFGFASKNFYASFLGLVLATQNANLFMKSATPARGFEFKVVSVGGHSVADVVAKYKVGKNVLATYNPDLSWSFLKKNGVFPSRYKLKLPPSPPKDPRFSKKPSLAFKNG